MRLWIVRIILFVLISHTCFGEQLSSERIAELLYAASQQYKTIDVEFEREGYTYINDSMELRHRGNIVYRSTFEKVYYSHEGEDFNYGGKKGNLIRTAEKIAVTPEYSKQLAWRGDTNAYEGLVTRKSLEDAMLSAPLEFLFEIFKMYDHNSLASKIVDVHKNEDGDYIIRVERSKKKGSYVDITIKPEHNFIPSKYVFTRNGTVGYNTEFSDFREVCPGIWLPFAYSYTHPGEATGKLRITKARVNVSLSDSEMDFDFPSGTYVIDRVAEIEYTAGAGVLKWAARILSGSESIQEGESSRRLLGAVCLIAFSSVIITIVVVRKRREQGKMGEMSK